MNHSKTAINKNAGQFIELDKTTHVLEFLRDGYESFHLTDEECILEELESHINNVNINYKIPRK